MTKTRNSIHKPVDFDPAAYEWFGAFDANPEPGSYVGRGNRETFELNFDGTTVTAAGTNWLNAHDSYLKGLLRNSSTSAFAKDDRGYQCDHCGAHIRYVAVLRHTPTGDYIAMGEQCLANRVDGVKSKAEFDGLRKASAEARAEHRIRKQIDAFFAENPDLRDILWPVPKDHGRSEFLGSLNRQLRRYGSLSEKQVFWARKSNTDWIEQQAKKAERDALPKVPAPEGLVVVVGEIVSVRLQEGLYGEQWKIVVRDDRGFAVWSTLPAAVRNAFDGAAEDLRGKRVTFTATLERSDRDECFAFAKRPRKATLLDSPSGEGGSGQTDGEDQ